MSATPSVMLALGTPAPDFQLPDVVTGKTISLGTCSGSAGLLVMFISRHCPFVQHIKDELARIGRDYSGKGIGVVAICSNDVVNYADDAPEKLKAMAVDLGFLFPFCYDEDQKTAQAYSAACTPDFFLFDGLRKLAYRGQLDDSRPGNGRPVTGTDLRSAMDALLEGRAINPDQRPSIGCNIKWKPGNEPSYGHK
jgi:thiol-disulfide isomerase/thioredoxin